MLQQLPRLCPHPLLPNLGKNPELTARITLSLKRQHQLATDLVPCPFNISSPHGCLRKSYSVKGQTGSSSVIIPFLLSVLFVGRRFIHDRANASFQLFSIDGSPGLLFFPVIEDRVAISSLPRICLISERVFVLLSSMIRDSF